MSCWAPRRRPRQPPEGPRGRRAPEARGAEATTWSAACWRARPFPGPSACMAGPGARGPSGAASRPRDEIVVGLEERGGWLRHDRGGWSVRFFGGFEWLQPIEEDGTAS
ncbi:unnamed protein product [Prorocentrum cordatum]|uniref:Uncharacterized protein n=1 Tax=Prorocentrum cordatum TaxID=2364126 RepID=A0ABN9W5G4_9DINO|nr:unnamed protein product [Polarella glacialis]